MKFFIIPLLHFNHFITFFIPIPLLDPFQFFTHFQHNSLFSSKLLCILSASFIHSSSLLFLITFFATSFLKRHIIQYIPSILFLAIIFLYAFFSSPASFIHHATLSHTFNACNILHLNWHIGPKMPRLTGLVLVSWEYCMCHMCN